MLSLLKETCFGTIFWKHAIFIKRDLAWNVHRFGNSRINELLYLATNHMSCVGGYQSIVRLTNSAKRSSDINGCSPTDDRWWMMNGRWVTRWTTDRSTQRSIGTKSADRRSIGIKSVDRRSIGTKSADRRFVSIKSADRRSIGTKLVDWSMIDQLQISRLTDRSSPNNLSDSPQSIFQNRLRKERAMMISGWF